MTDGIRAHWDKVYTTKPAHETSWYEPTSQNSIALIRNARISSHDPIIDVGGGASRLVDELLSAGYQDVTVLDVSGTVLNTVRERLGTRADAVRFLQTDITAFRPTRQYALWHDRAVFHFLTAPEDRRRYVDALRASVRPGGHVIMATFGPQGPQRCSGLPVVRYEAATLGAELGSEFELVETSLSVHHTPGGAEQQFLYCRFLLG
jgi:2-polyprenyl-3-methyl-5-hydroxy-6-metoxy-1,4-benzoquinol methylase